MTFDELPGSGRILIWPNHHDGGRIIRKTENDIIIDWFFGSGITVYTQKEWDGNGDHVLDRIKVIQNGIEKAVERL